MTSVDRKAMRAADLIEQAAKLTWAKAHVKDAEGFVGLHVEEQASLARLFSAGKGKNEMHRIQRVVATLITPVPSPVKPAGDGADVAAALAAAVTAAAAAAAAAAKIARPRQDSGSARGRRSGDESLRRDDVIGAIEVDADAPSPRARTARRKANSTSPLSKATSPAAGVGSKRRGRERSEDKGRELVFMFVKKD